MLEAHGCNFVFQDPLAGHPFLAPAPRNQGEIHTNEPQGEVTCWNLPA